MQYLKSYKIFESSSHISIEDIKDICLEMVDKGIFVSYKDPKFNSTYYPMSMNTIAISYTSISSPIKWIDIKDTILRLIDYLGNNFIKMDIRDRDLNIKSYMNSSWSEIGDDEMMFIISFYYTMETNYFQIESTEIIGEFSKFTELEIHTIDDVLKPFKSYEPGHHSDDPDYIKRCTEYEFSTFNRSIVFYPLSSGRYGRAGYNWFLTSDSKLKEISISKYVSGYFEVKFTYNHSHGFMLYIAKDLDSLISLINDKI